MCLEKAQLVVFDMNGLIVDDEAVQMESVNRVVDQFHIHINEEYWIKECLGRRADVYLNAILKRKNIAIDIIAMVEEKNRWYKRMIAHSVHRLIRPGVQEIIDYLWKIQSHTLALATSALPGELETIMGKKGVETER